MFWPDNFTNAEFVGFVDDDTVFVGDVRREDIFDIEGRPRIVGIWGCNTFRCQYAHSVKYALGFPEVMKGMTYFPVILKTSHIVEMRDFILQQHPRYPTFDLLFRSINRLGRYSQFHIMVNYVWRFHRDEYFWTIQPNTEEFHGYKYEKKYHAVGNEIDNDLTENDMFPFPRIALHYKYDPRWRFRRPHVLIKTVLKKGECFSLGLKAYKSTKCSGMDFATNYNENQWIWENVDWRWHNSSFTAHLQRWNAPSTKCRRHPSISSINLLKRPLHCKRSSTWSKSVSLYLPILSEDLDKLETWFLPNYVEFWPVNQRDLIIGLLGNPKHCDVVEEVLRKHQIGETSKCIHIPTKMTNDSHGFHRSMAIFSEYIGVVSVDTVFATDILESDFFSSSLKPIMAYEMPKRTGLKERIPQPDNDFTIKLPIIVKRENLDSFLEHKENSNSSDMIHSNHVFKFQQIDSVLYTLVQYLLGHHRSEYKWNTYGQRETLEEDNTTSILSSPFPGTAIRLMEDYRAEAQNATRTAYVKQVRIRGLCYGAGLKAWEIPICSRFNFSKEINPDQWQHLNTTNMMLPEVFKAHSTRWALNDRISCL